MEAKYDQSNFTLGEIDPKCYQRSDWDGYYKSLKYLRNAVVLPQGGFTGRWGSTFVDTLTIVDPNTPLQAELSVLLYDDNSIYVLIWEDSSLKIYLENTLIATLTTPAIPYKKEDVPSIRTTQIQDRLIVTNVRFRPYQLIRSANPANIITGVDNVNNYILLTNPITVNTVYPVTFTTSGNLPTTLPIIYTNITYFVNAVLPNSARLYANASDAKNGQNYFTVTNAGTGVNTLYVQNTWTFNPINFKFYPSYDFTGNYDGTNFSVSATTGNITLTATNPIFSAAYIGGVFTGNSGVMRITGCPNATTLTGYTSEDFNGTGVIVGTLAFLAEPAWSDLRGWPALCSSYQSRSVFARTASIPNGRWLSTVNDVFNFDDSLKLDDDAISIYPNGSGNGFIQSLTSARTLLVHTNTNTQSTPVLNEAPITPLNATFPEQSKFGATDVQPIFLDNQIIFVDKANNIINMIWEITQSQFVTKNISVTASHLIGIIQDMAAFAQPVKTDGFYALFINQDGTMAVFQSLIEENVRGWSLINTKTTIVSDTNYNGNDVNSSFVRVATGGNRCWLTVSRLIPRQSTPVAITAIDAINNTITAIAHGLTLNQSNIISFTTTGILPATNPSINNTQYFFARGIDANTFAIYGSQDDANNNVNKFDIITLGLNSNVIAWPLQKNIYLEEIDFNIRQDASLNFKFDTPQTVINGLGHLNGCVVKVIADGYLLNDKVVFNGSITLEVSAKNVIVGLQFVVKGVPLPIAIPGVMGVLNSPTHVRAMYIAYLESIGVTIQGTNITTVNMQDEVLDSVPTPQTGVCLYTPMEGWDGFEHDLEIVQENPLPITITGLSYRLELGS